MTRNTAQSGAESSLIPDKLYFRIGEVARLCGVETYVLRFWETEFPQLKPNKGGTGQRLYRKRDVEMALRIKRLLHAEGYTIAGARQVFATEGRDGGSKGRQPELPLDSAARSGKQPAAEKTAHSKMERLRLDLKDLLRVLSLSPGTATGMAAQRDPKPRRSEEGGKEAGPTLFGV